MEMVELNANKSISLEDAKQRIRLVLAQLQESSAMQPFYFVLFLVYVRKQKPISYIPNSKLSVQLS
jgi:hypothetical protein